MIKAESDFIDKDSKERRNYRCIMYVQYVEYLHIDVDDLENIMRENFSYPDYQWAYIFHDKDYVDAEHEEFKKKHLHVMIYSPNGIALTKLREVFQEPNNNYFEFMRNKDAGFLYLTHNTKRALQDFKHVYSEKEVVANFDYSNYLTKKVTNNDREDVDIVIEKIGNGEVTLSDLFENKRLYHLYLRHSIEFNRALDVYRMKVDKEIRSGERSPKKN